MDPRLQSIHLEAMPRREEFRRARAAIQGAFGQHTMAGELRPAASAKDLEAVTCIRGDESISPSPSGPVCWLMDRGQPRPLKIGLNSIGRLPDNDVVIDDPCVSRRHCAVLVHSDLTCELHDIASKNGTTVNGHRLQGPTRLREGDEINLCDRKLTLAMSLRNPPGPRARFDDDATLAG
jgi:pSer/pThr/pTyr-binding forkhead associated (FHA) protein